MRKILTILGKIVRIGPQEVSIHDFDVFVGVIYKQASPFLKVCTTISRGSSKVKLKVNQDASFYRAFTNESDDIFTTSNAADHSTHRRLISQSFARKNILEFESQIWDHAKLLSEIVGREYAGCSEATLDLVQMYRCLTLDVISTFAFGQSINALRKPRFQEELLDAFDWFSPISYFVSAVAP